MRHAALVLLLPLAPGCGTREPERPKNLLLVSIDTLRADRLGCYGYGRATSPALDRFAREHAVRFADVLAEAPWTLPSHVTLLSGLHPLHHGVSLPEHVPAPGIEFLAQTLQRAGYATLALTGGGWISADFGFDRGFDSFRASELSCADNVGRAIDALRERADPRPWFAFLHTYEVHCPYDPPEPYFSMFSSADAAPIEVAGRCGNPDFNALRLEPGQVTYLSDRYDGSIRSVDDALGTLLAFLERSGRLADTVVVITSDHGEELGDHGRIGHERSLYHEVLAVPLLVAAPGIPPGVVHDPVSLADVAPTVLELLGIAGPACDGASRVPLLRGERTGGPGEPRLSCLAWKEDLVSIVDGAQHLILDRGRGRAQCFDLAADPAEMRDSSRSDENTRVLRNALERRVSELGRDPLAPGTSRLDAAPSAKVPAN